MRMFGTKQPETTDEDRVAAARLSAVAARFKAEQPSEFTEVSPDPIGEPQAADDEPEASEDEEAPGENE